MTARTWRKVWKCNPTTGEVTGPHKALLSTQKGDHDGKEHLREHADTSK